MTLLLIRIPYAVRALASSFRGRYRPRISFAFAEQLLAVCANQVKVVRGVHKTVILDLKQL